MITFSFGVLLLLAAIAALVLGRKAEKYNATLDQEHQEALDTWSNERGYRGNRPEREEAIPLWVPRLVAGVCIFFGLGFIASATVSHVPARNVGIVSSYSKPTGRTTDPGLHTHKPWETIEDWDGTRQAFEHNNEKSCVQVRIANLSNACVEVLVEWKTRDAKAPEQWASYRKEFDRFVGKRVNPGITGALNEVFTDHDPLANIDKADGKLNVPLGPFMTATKNKIEERIGGDIEVLSVAITRVNYDEKTQGQIDQYQAAILKGRVLEKDYDNALLAKKVTETNAQVDQRTRCLEQAKEQNKEPGYCMWTNGFPAVK